MTEQIVMIDPSVLKVHPRNEEFFNDVGEDERLPIVEYSEYSLMKNALVQGYSFVPIVVTPSLMVYSGVLRLKMALEIGMKEVPVIIDNTKDENDVLFFMVTGSVRRNWKKINAIKKANWIDTLLKLKDN